MTSAENFFGGGGAAFKFHRIGDAVTGIVDTIHDPEPQTDIKTGQVIEKNGRPKLQLRVEIMTDLRDPERAGDDGRRTLYVKGGMQYAIGLALQKHGLKGLQIGGRLTVAYTGDGTPPQPGFDGPKKFEADYTPAPPGGDFFANGGGQSAPATPGQSPATQQTAAQQPAAGGMTPEQQIAAAQAQIAAANAAQAQATQQPAAPAPPAGFTAEAWAGMDEPTRAAILRMQS